MLERALTLHRQGRADLAEPIYREIVDQDPACAEAWHLLGVVELQRGNATAAVRNLEQACQIDENNPKYLNNLGSAYGISGRMDDAETTLRKAFELDPSNLDSLYNLGTSHQQNGNEHAAANIYAEILRQDPNHMDALNNFGAICKNLGQTEKAIELFNRALQCNPTNTPARMNLGSIYEERGDTAAAANHFDVICNTSPSSAASLKRNLLLPVAYGSSLEIEEIRAKFEDNLDRLLENPPQIHDVLSECSRSAFFLAYQGYNDRRLNEKLGQLYQRSSPSINFVADHVGTASSAGAKIKIGFVSRYFRNHTIAKLNCGLIAKLPRDEFEVIVFSLRNDDDELAKFIRHHSDQFIVLPSNLSEARESIAARRLDILFYTDIGMDPFTYLLAFAKLAPVQCVTWGHPVTTGLQTIDFFVSCVAGESDTAEDHYSERLVRLDQIPTFYFRPEPVAAGAPEDFGLGSNRNLYVCPQTLFKLHPEIDQVFAEILECDPLAQFLLIDMGNELAKVVFQERFRKAYGRLTDRIEWLPRLTQKQFLQLLSLANVLLDTFPFCGGNTSLEAFAVGTPIVTFPGEFLRGRVTTAMYEQMGLGDYVSTSPKELAERAISIASDKDYRAQLSHDISERTNTLFENELVVRSFADFFRSAAG